jgi:hypothetical protein
MKHPSEGYLLAKRQLVEAIDHKLEQLAPYKMHVDYPWAFIVSTNLEQLRDYVRNGMLWSKENGE